MAEETTNNLTGKRVSTTFRGLLHFPKSIDPSLAKQIVYDGTGTPSALTLGGDTKGADISGPLTCNDSLSIDKDATIVGNLNIGKDIILADGGKVNDVEIHASNSAISLRAPSAAEVGKLRIRETTSDYELLFGNPTLTEKNLFSVIVKNDINSNFYIKNSYSDLDINAPLWINRSTGEVNIKSLRVNNIKTVLPPGVSTPPGQEINYGPSNRNVIPVGMIVMFPVLGIPNGWIPCDGKEHNKQTLPELFSVIEYNYSVLKTGDLFQVPDYRGLFVRGMDYQRTDESSRIFIDPDGARTLNGTTQQDAMQNITGSFGADDRMENSSSITGAFYKGSSADTGSEGTETGYKMMFDASRVVRTSTETRPTNVVALYCIKW